MIVVVGAGPAGLAAAWSAARAGHEVTVVESSDRVGGMAASFEVAGVRVDHGSHRLHPAADPAVLADVRRLLGSDLQTRTRHGRIRLSDRWVAFPLRPADLVRRLPPRFAAGAAFDALASPWRRPRRDTFDEVVRAGLGPTVAGQFYAPYARKLWDTDPGQLAGELARRRVSASSPADVLRRLAGRERTERSTFLYPRTGFGAICERLAEAAGAAGAKLTFGARVVGIDTAGADRVAVTLAGGATLDADRVWSTAPLPALARMVRPAPPDGVLEAAGRLRHRAVVLVYAVVDRPQWTPFDAHYFPGPEVAAARVSEPKNYRDNPDDPPDRTVVCAEVPCWEGDPTWSAEPEQLAADLDACLVRLGLPPLQPVAVEVRRLPRVYPVYPPGFEWDLSALELWLATEPRLLAFGRQGLFVPDNSHHALAMGRAAAGALGRDGTFDAAAWAAARDRFHHHVVED